MTLVFLKLLAVEGKWLPALGTPLFEYGADGEVGGVGGEREWGVGPRVVKEGGFSQSLFDGLE